MRRHGAISNADATSLHSHRARVPSCRAGNRHTRRAIARADLACQSRAPIPIPRSMPARAAHIYIYIYIYIYMREHTRASIIPAQRSAQRAQTPKLTHPSEPLPPLPPAGRDPLPLARWSSSLSQTSSFPPLHSGFRYVKRWASDRLAPAAAASRCV